MSLSIASTIDRFQFPVYFTSRATTILILLQHTAEECDKKAGEEGQVRRPSGF